MEQNQGFVVKDIERYERALTRAKMLGLPEYVGAFKKILEGMQEIVRIDEELMKKGG